MQGIAFRRHKHNKMKPRGLNSLGMSKSEIHNSNTFDRDDDSAISR